jgi:hypothetical protein
VAHQKHRPQRRLDNRSADYFPTRPEQQYRPGEDNRPAEDYERPRRGWLSRLADQFQDEINMAKGIAVGAVLQEVSKEVQKSVPNFASHIEKIVDSIQEKVKAGSPSKADKTF